MNFYYGLVDKENKAWGFLEETDDRAWKDKEHTELKDDMIFLTEAEWQAVLSEQSRGRQIVGYQGKCFTAEQGRYYVDDNAVWQKKTDEEFNKEKADAKCEELVNKLYEIKAKKAYGGLIINDMIIFETNQTSVTNTVASLALMDDEGTSNWKFYTLDGNPYVTTITKAQLAFLAKFGQNMINQCFAIEGTFNVELQNATIENLIDTAWVEDFVLRAQAATDEVNNKITITLGE